jgi:hypothetical protein
MSPDVEEMLVLHEVGHALFTTEEGYGAACLKERVLSQYANVVEDVRIERKMKERYPGSRKSFFIGYKSLNDRDFFGVRNANVNSLVLIDRINLYYKVGYNCGVKFTDQERKFLTRIEAAETEAEVIDIARDIYNFSKTEQKKKKEDLLSRVTEEDDEDDFGDYSDSSVESEDQEESEEKDFDTKRFTRGSSTDSEDVDESDLESKTYEKLKNSLEDISDPDVMFTYFTPNYYLYSQDKFFNEVVSFKEILKGIREHKTTQTNWGMVFAKRDAGSILSTNNVVSYLNKEFEMKKAATSYRLAKVSKTGQIDSKKLYSYSLRDDIFRSITKMNDAKNHGMIFLLDWSSSMNPYISEILDQVVNLSLFCHRAQIPFQVLAFSDRYSVTRRGLSYVHSVDKNGIGSNTSFNLLEFFSNKMTMNEMNEMIDYLCFNRDRLPTAMSLGSTPLNDSLVFMSNYIGKFIKTNSIEKMTFVTLTDGESGKLVHYAGSMSSRIFVDGVMMKNKAFLCDPLTRREYHISSDPAIQTSALLQLIKDRYNTNNLAFFVVRNRYFNVNSFMMNNFTGWRKAGDIEEIRLSLKSNGYYIFNNMPGRDEYYLLDSKKLNVEDGDFESLDSNSNSRQIARTFSKVMNTRKTSRVVLNSFIKRVS